MALGEVNSFDGKCPHGLDGYPPHNELVGKVGLRDGRVWAVCANHVENYAKYPATYTVELFPVVKEEVAMSEAESHFHPCPSCQQAVECLLPIGDSSCGQMKCANCTQPQTKANRDKHPPAGHLLSSTWVCVNGCSQPSNSTMECPHCGEAKPTLYGKCSQGHPISVLYDKCFYGHDLDPDTAGTPAKAEPVEAEEPDNSEECSGCGHKYGRHSNGRTGSCHKEDCKCPHWNAPPIAAEEEEAETCDNCGEDITPENPAREFDGDDMCKSCHPPICSTCEEELADDDDDWSRCNNCSDYVCKDCRWWCHCCEVYMCKGCANNGDHGISQGD